MDRSNTTTMPDLQKLNGGFLFNFGNGELLLAEHTRGMYCAYTWTLVIRLCNVIFVHNHQSFIPAIMVVSLSQTCPITSHVLPKNICFVWSGAISVLSRPLMDAEII